MAVKLTNKHNLPETFVRASRVDKHRVRGDISVTQLIDAPQPRILRRHNDTEEDVMDKVWAIMGTAVHSILEMADIDGKEAKVLFEAAALLADRGEEKGAKWLIKWCKDQYPDSIDETILLETSLTHEILDWTISGTMDRFDTKTGTLSDYKNCSVYSYIFTESKKKWVAQLNVYAFMLRALGYEVKEIYVLAFFRDWSRSALLRNRDYPKTPVMQIPIEMYDDEFMENYLRNRILLHKEAENGNIPECTGKDRWATADKYAVKKPTLKKAIKLFDKEVLAQDFIRQNSQKHLDMFIEFRPGEDKRCASFCSVAHVCPQRKERLAIIAKNAENNEI
ncbi:MAG: hypothetical protein COB15_09590 [Flavobacteriales bacterium]|jgi:hypothetical protein|nr:MAG: hypothetical protein COB15_09590 [Flavobacteriales bacterium]